MKLEQNQNSNIDSDLQRGVLLETKTKTKKPSMYNVLLINDDYTPMEFVVLLLEKIFNKKQEEATQIMIHGHKNGVGVCGTYSFEASGPTEPGIIQKVSWIPSGCLLNLDPGCLGGRFLAVWFCLSYTRDLWGWTP